MDDLINQITSIISTWQQAGIVAGMVLLVNLLTNLTKIPAVSTHVPPVIRPWIAIGLGIVTGFLTAFTAGKPLAYSVVSGMMVGLGAIGTHELATTARPAVRAMRIQAKTMMRKTTTTILLFGMLGITSISCHGYCAEPAHAGKLVCTLENNVLDCTKPEILPTIIAFMPIALAYAATLIGQDGKVDWQTFGSTMANTGRGDALCIYQKTVAEVTKPKTGITLPRGVPHVDPSLQKELAIDVRYKFWPGLKVKTEDGIQ